HIQRFNHLADGIESGSIDLEKLEEIENRDTIFQELDFSVYRS
ncbi:MAG: 1,4-alpha-glucan branching enzyme C-terminal, partial [Blastocatellia bacterium]|nr:1,4-alpha-glucan branching enzyme C-terminal [Blastocatellia bacterium]